MTRFQSTRYPNLWIPALKVRFTGGVADVDDPEVASRLASWPTPGVGLASGEDMPVETPEPERPAEVVKVPDEAPAEPEEPERPAKTARREEWEHYILATYDVDADEAKAMNRAQLQEMDADLSGDE